jgi:hypothetical protein
MATVVKKYWWLALLQLMLLAGGVVFLASRVSNPKAIALAAPAGGQTGGDGGTQIGGGGQPGSPSLDVLTYSRVATL